MTTQSLKKTAVVFILSFSIVSGFAYHNQTTGSLQAQVLETKLELKMKEEQYKKEINNLKKLLLSNKSTLAQRDKQIDKISKAKKELEIKQKDLLALESEVSALKSEIKKYESKITKDDAPDLKDTSVISKIDVNVVNEKFKGGVLEGKGKLMVQIAEANSISPHFFCALIALESGYGKSKLAKSKNNLGGIKGSKNAYRSFESVDECLVYMGKLLREKYHEKGLIDINKIQKRYAPSWDAAGNRYWVKNIQSLMKKIHLDALS